MAVPPRSKSAVAASPMNGTSSASPAWPARLASKPIIYFIILCDPTNRIQGWKRGVPSTIALRSVQSARLHALRSRRT